MPEELVPIIEDDGRFHEVRPALTQEGRVLAFLHGAPVGEADSVLFYPIALKRRFRSDYSDYGARLAGLLKLNNPDRNVLVAALPIDSYDGIVSDFQALESEIMRIRENVPLTSVMFMPNWDLCAAAIPATNHLSALEPLVITVGDCGSMLDSKSAQNTFQGNALRDIRVLGAADSLEIAVGDKDIAHVALLPHYTAGTLFSAAQKVKLLRERVARNRSELHEVLPELEEQATTSSQDLVDFTLQRRIRNLRDILDDPDAHVVWHNGAGGVALLSGPGGGRGTLDVGILPEHSSVASKLEGFRTRQGSYAVDGTVEIACFGVPPMEVFSRIQAQMAVGHRLAVSCRNAAAGGLVADLVEQARANGAGESVVTGDAVFSQADTKLGDASHANRSDPTSGARTQGVQPGQRRKPS